MSVSINGGIIQLKGRCEHESVEPLIELIHEHPSAQVDVSNCESLNTAVFQVLFCMKVPVLGAAKETSLEQNILPMLNRREQGAQDG